MPYYSFDSLGFIITLPALILAIYSRYLVENTYRKYAQVRSARGYTGQQAARIILDRFGLYHVLIEENRGRGRLSDHYDPRVKVIRLSSEVYNNSSIAAIGIAAHECGHAIQHEKGYIPLTLRNAIIPVTTIGSRLAVPVLLAGFFFGAPLLIGLGITAYALMTVFQLITLPVEFNASRRALAVIDDAFLLDGEERMGARKVLTAAAMTYVAALISSLAQLLRLVLLSRRRR